MGKKTLRTVCLCMAAMVLLSGCSPVTRMLLQEFVHAAKETPEAAVPSPSPAPLPDYDEIDYQHPDMDLAYGKIREVTRLAEASDGEGMLRAFDELLAVYEQICSLYVYASIQLDCDVYDEYFDQELAVLDEEFLQLDKRMDALTNDLMDWGYTGQLQQRYGNGFIKQAEINKLITGDDIQSRLIEEQELEREYNRIAVDFTVNFDGREWNYDQILADTELSYRQYEKLRQAYCDALGEKVWPVFDQMRQLRGEIAASAGYGNYTEYSYDYYARDYAPEDAQTLYAAVKEYVVPLYIQLATEYFQLDTDEYYAQQMSFWSAMELFDEAAQDFSPQLSEAFSCMLDRGLYDVWPGAKKVPGAYTTQMRAYDAPFLYMSWDDTPQSLTIFIHEMGHFAAEYLRRDRRSYCEYAPLDLMEVESQGLELLFLHYYDDFFTDRLPAAYNTLLDSLYSLISGCMEDEFQQALYGDMSMGFDQACALYERLGAEYGLSEVFLFEDSSWVLIPHTFNSPLYYFSYAIATVPVLEMFDLAQTNMTRAREIYWMLQQRKDDASFLTTLETCGLSDPFSPDLLERLCQSVENYLEDMAVQEGKAA